MKRTLGGTVRNILILYAIALFTAYSRSGIPLRYMIVLAGALAVVPVGYDLFKGREAMKELLKSPVKTAELVFLSAAVFEIVWLLVRVYLNVLAIPNAIKY